MRDQIIPVLMDVLSKGNDLGKSNVNHPLFSTRPWWPDMQTLFNLPLNVQCEELDFAEGSLRTTRIQVIDVEVVVIKEQLSVDKLSSPS